MSAKPHVPWQPHSGCTPGTWSSFRAASSTWGFEGPESELCPFMTDYIREVRDPGTPAVCVMAMEGTLGRDPFPLGSPAPMGATMNLFGRLSLLLALPAALSTSVT